MNTGSLRRRAVTASALVLTGALALSACGEKKDESAQPTTKVTPKTGADQALAAKVPADVKSDGNLSVGTDATYAPMEFLDTDNKTVIGFDADVISAVAGKLGLKATFTPAPFAAVIPGVTSGKTEAAISSFTINPDRKKQVNMISYFQGATQWLVKSGNPDKIDINNACGKKVAVQKDTTQSDEDVPKRQKACKSASKPGITVDPYQDQGQATTSVATGKDQAMLADAPVVQYAVKKTNGQLETLGEAYDPFNYGIVVDKKQTQLAEAVQGAVQALIADGTIKQIADKWALKSGFIEKSVINP
ncbi:ABC transporter substrate-binding protein [Actinomadura barringtoniae]|uniref:ABC transporter substrate-binding protein n=1 Tax=Actinomadura barringtoniae TaxID=1427535 RepID=A0A939PDI0_9ACTN|nr:ABC transporter substrate-binding protein [Actinomadura barringtoniae]MBO2450343.1 ABC transporter substrate-binding protein [Actinomadura barringtoniae]